MDANLQTPQLPGRSTGGWEELPPQDAATAVLTFNHKLGRLPHLVTVRLRAKKDGSNGVEKGMEMDLAFQDSDRDSTHSAITTVWLTDTKVIVKGELAPNSLTRWQPDGTEVSYTVGFPADEWEVVVRVQ